MSGIKGNFDARDSMTELFTRLKKSKNRMLLRVLIDEHFSGMLSYIMIDANNLKKINDSLRHKRGDELITTIAKCMESGVEKFSQNAKCYRIGGDEFAIRLQNVTRAETESCIKSVREKIAEADQKTDIPISAAIGYEWSNEAIKDTEKLLQNADAAMYENKQKMKKRINEVG